MRTCLLIFLLAVPSAALADTWIPYTDGRVGGCFQNRVGHLYGCTPQPQHRSTRNDGLDLPRDDGRLRRAEQENALLREQNRQLEAERVSRDADEARERERRQRSVQAISDDYAARQARARAAEARRREQAWSRARTGCDSPAYSRELESMGLQRHPSYPAICVPKGFKSGSNQISAQACPPC